MHKYEKVEDFILNRREFLQRSGMGFGALGYALTSGLTADASSIASHTPKAPHFPAKAKRVIHIFLNGGLSHVDSFDPKPALEKYAGKELPSSYETERKTGGGFPSQFKFNKHGESGIEVSELFPKLAECVDDICFIRSMHTNIPAHGPSMLMMNCGDNQLSRPSVGSWVTYGLGTENQNLPGFVTMCPGGFPTGESQNWQAGFLPSPFQGSYVDSQYQNVEKLVRNIKSHYTSKESQRKQLDLLSELNYAHRKKRQDDAALEGRIQSYELAYRMQFEATDAFDITREPEYIRELYGNSVQSRQMLIARRLLERGVRFIQLWHGPGQPWDSHDDVREQHKRLSGQCDQGIAALLKDLKQRGMLDDTLVLCTGEFGRTPTVEIAEEGISVAKGNGRDHNHHGFTAWMAGGGIKGGHVHGATDEFGFKAVENPVHVHDLHATILNQLGFDHERLTYRHAGRDFRLTDVEGNVIHDIIA
ncbi:MAG: DUF1501 domain-containing protein [Candidatus Hydrogenedentota bacterium]